jgi:hypothetical protein
VWETIPGEPGFDVKTKRKVKTSKKDPNLFPPLYWRGDFPPPLNQPTPGGSSEKFSG